MPGPVAHELGTSIIYFLVNEQHLIKMARKKHILKLATEFSSVIPTEWHKSIDQTNTMTSFRYGQR